MRWRRILGNWREYVYGACATALLFQLFAVGLADAVGPTVGPSLAVENIAPGQSVKAGAISLDADTNAEVLEWEGDGDGAADDPDHWPIPHGARVTIKLRDATEVTCCYLPDADEAATTMIGAQSGNTTRFNVAGGTEGACFTLVGAGDSWTEVVNYYALVDQGVAPAGVCSTASDNDDSTFSKVFSWCADDADCALVGGNSTSPACDTSPRDDGSSSTLNMHDKLPGVYIACRALAATDVDYWVTR